MKLLNELKDLQSDIGIKEIVCVVNKISSLDEDQFVRSKLEDLGIKIIGTIPRDPLVVKADMEGKALVDYPDSEALAAIKNISKNILEWKG